MFRHAGSRHTIASALLVMCASFGSACAPSGRAAAAGPDAGAGTPDGGGTSAGDGGDAGSSGADAGSGGSDAGQSDAGPGDAGSSMADAGPGMTADAGVGGLSCGAIFACQSMCDGASACLAQCAASGTAAAQQYAEALGVCLGAVCPTTGGGVCADQGSSCQMCEGGALTNGCAVLYAACERDSSGGPDAGSTALDAGPSTSDAGNSFEDAGTGSSDAGEAMTDGGAMAGDAGGEVSDAGIGAGDAGVSDAGAGSSDAGEASPDAGSGRPDAGAGDAGPVPGVDSCFDVQLCSMGCDEPACFQRCLGLGTAAAAQDFSSLLSCIGTACPNTGGGVCDSNSPGYNGTNCNNCNNTAEGFGGPCYAEAVECSPVGCTQDSECSGLATSPVCDPSYGVCVQCIQASGCPTGSSCVDYVCQPADLGCVAIINCTQACSSQPCIDACVAAGVPAGQVDYTGYVNCQNAACPTTNGRVCDTTAPGFNQTSCDNCIQMAQNGTCLPQIEACIASCGSDVDCAITPATPACDTLRSTCVQCAQSSDCATDWICASNVCIKTCSSATDCPADETCSGGICVAG